MPNLHNSLSLKYTRQLLPGLIAYIVPLLIGLYLLRWKGTTRIIAFALIIFSILAMIDYNPMRSSLYSQYAGDQGIKPFQDMIDYINRQGGYAFWNYPEQKSGTRPMGPIYLDTPPYPQVLHESRDYSGFASIYGAKTTITNPGREWDRVLKIPGDHDVSLSIDAEVEGLVDGRSSESFGPQRIPGGRPEVPPDLRSLVLSIQHRVVR